MSSKKSKSKADPWDRLVEYLLVLQSPTPPLEKEKRLRKLEKEANKND